MLRQTQDVSRLTTSFTAHPSAKRKLVLRPIGKTLDLSPFASSPTLPFTPSTDQDSIGTPSMGVNLNRELESVVPCIILEPEEEEEEMTPNLRVGFKERQHKCLFE